MGFHDTCSVRNVNILPLKEYDYVFAISNIHRPPTSLLEQKFASYNDDIKKRLLKLVSFWEYFFPNSSSTLQKDNIEEWLEEVCLLESALKVLKKVFILLPNCSLPTELQKLPYIGHIPGTKPHLFEQNNNLDNDLIFPELESFLGRKIILAKSNYNDILEKSEFMLSKYGSIYLKWMGVSKVRTVRRLSSIEEVNEYLKRDLYMLELYWNNRISIQQGLTLENEMRFFVVNGELADYSPIEWWRTPLDSKGNIEVKEYLQKLECIIAALKNGGSVSNQTYVIDLAYDKLSKEVILVEMNPIHNSGLYSINTDEYIRKIKENPKDFVLRKIF